MCFGSKSKPEPDAADGPPLRQTVIRNPNLFRTPTFDQGRARRASGRRESPASGHSPSESLRNYDGAEERLRNLSTVSPGYTPSEKRYSTNNAGDDEVAPVVATRAGTETDVGTESASTSTAVAPAPAPEIKGLEGGDRRSGDGVIR
ncbi:hypothetical protein EPUS_01781 [Endocarpon pusillum Z07020]|uniref:Uncharacterized protein n=1 Tax=Endocarpon pusillum (strain Z07020 / HMAS-L-300199) TaxID=1263415 RepID=U1GJ44_ENDPU|nr:uncharacterized protein EPUS_01781 [Endocarpon pusillum Z07020]ERF71866.1 hypothetical protein EPUS_01781 [Endocarpon pusillum Z07020]